MLPKNFPNRKEKRQREAQERQSKRDARTDQQQLDRLNLMFSPGAKKERARLEEKLSPSVDSRKYIRT